MEGCWWAGRGRRSARLLLVDGARRVRLVGQVAAGAGGPQVWLNSWVHAVRHGQSVGRCRVSRRAEQATRPGTVISVRRMVAVVALASLGPLMAAAARVRLKAMQAS